MILLLGTYGCFDPSEMDFEDPTSGGTSTSTGVPIGDTSSSGSNDGSTTDPDAETTTTGLVTATVGLETSSSGGDEGTSSTGEPPIALCDDGVPVAGELCFGGATVLEASDVVYTPRLGDTNGDGNPDIVYVNSDTIIARLGDGMGTFGPEIESDTMLITRTELGDVDGDGILDIVGVNNYDSTFTVARGNGTAMFSAPDPSPTVSDPVALSLGDLNGDGRDDAVVVSGQGGLLRSYVADASGLLTVEDSTGLGANYPARAVALGDFTSDGVLDVAYTASGAPPMIALGDGSGDFGAPIDVVLTTTDPHSIAAADFDQDGNDDLAIADGSTLHVTYGTGAAAFTDAIALDLDDPLRSLHSADMNSDGAPDLVLTYAERAEVTILPNLGDGTFGYPLDIATGTACESMTTADANLDGVPDIILGCDVIFVRVLLSTP